MVDEALKKKKKKHDWSNLYADRFQMLTPQMGAPVHPLQHVRRNALVMAQREIALKQKPFVTFYLCTNFANK